MTASAPIDPSEPHAKLLRRAQQGDQEAFDRILDVLWPRMNTLALTLVRNQADADDIVAEACVKIWRALPRFKRSSGLWTWVYRIETNCFKDWLRARFRVESRTTSLDRTLDDDEDAAPLQVPDPSPGPAETAERKEERTHAEYIVPRILGRLHPSYRILLILRYMLELSTEAILDFLESALSEGGIPADLPQKEGVTLRQIDRLHGEICPRHDDDPKQMKKKRNSYDLKLFHAREAFRKALEEGGASK